MKTLEQIKQDYPYATIMTIGEYYRKVKNHNLTAWNGYGYYHDGETETKQKTNFNLNYIDSVAVKYYPYVCWYNN